MCRGTSFLEFRFLIFPIYIQKIILVGNGERGRGSRERVTRSGMRNENEEWGVGNGGRGSGNGERGTSSVKGKMKKYRKKNPAYFPVQSVTSSPIACFVPITSFSPFLVFVSRYFGDFSKDPKLAGTHHLKDKNIDSFSPF